MTLGDFLRRLLRNQRKQRITKTKHMTDMVDLVMCLGRRGTAELIKELMSCGMLVTVATKPTRETVAATCMACLVIVGESARRPQIAIMTPNATGIRAVKLAIPVEK